MNDRQTVIVRRMVRPLPLSDPPRPTGQAPRRARSRTGARGTGQLVAVAVEFEDVAEGNQIGQTPAPVAEGVGYSLLPRSGLAAFTNGDRLRIVSLPKPRHHELWAIARRGRVPSARLRRIMGVVEDLAVALG